MNVYSIDLNYFGFYSCYFTGTIGYFILGYALSRLANTEHFKVNSKIILIIPLGVFLLSTWVIAYKTYVTTVELGELNLYWYSNYSIATFAQVTSLFIGLLSIKPKSNIWAKVSSYTFGIYLVHIFFVLQFKEYVSFGENNLEFIVKLLFMIFLTYTDSYLVTYIVKKVPFLRKLV